MVNIYTVPNNSSSKKACRWFKNNGISYHARNVKTEPLTCHNIEQLLCLTNNGVSDLLAKNSNDYQYLTKKRHIDINSLSLFKCIRLISNYYGIIRFPIMFDKNHLVIGYSQNKIRCFIPPKVRALELKHMSKELSD